MTVYITVKSVKIPVFVQHGIQGPIVKEEWLAWPNINTLHCAGLSNEHFMEKVLFRFQLS